MTAATTVNMKSCASETSLVERQKDVLRTRMFASRQVNSVKKSGWFGFWTGVASDQWQDWCAQRHSSKELQRGIEREWFKQRQYHGAAHFGGTIRGHPLARFIGGQLRRTGHAHQLSAFGAHLRRSNCLAGRRIRHHPRPCRRLTKQAKQSSSEQQQTKPTLHTTYRIAAAPAKVNSSIAPVWLQLVVALPAAGALRGSSCGSINLEAP